MNQIFQQVSLRQQPHPRRRWRSGSTRVLVDVLAFENRVEREDQLASIGASTGCDVLSHLVLGVQVAVEV